MIKLYSRLCLGHSCRTLQQCYDEINKVKVEYKIGVNNQFEQKISELPKNIHLKFKWECSFYENSTLEEMKEDQRV